jgi:hypothetical protein
MSCSFPKGRCCRSEYLETSSVTSAFISAGSCFSRHAVHRDAISTTQPGLGTMMNQKPPGSGQDPSPMCVFLYPTGRNASTRRRVRVRVCRNLYLSRARCFRRCREIIRSSPARRRRKFTPAQKSQPSSLMTTARAVLAAIRSNASNNSSLILKLIWLPLGMVEKDLRPLNTTAAPLA